MKRGVRYFKSLRFSILLFSLLTLCVGITFGQAISGNLVGTISDPTGAVVANAEVTATNVGTSASVVTHTNSTGEYRFDNLPVGAYKITVKATGFRTVIEQTDVELNKTGTRNARVTPGATSETVEVTGAAPTIDTTTAQLQSTFDPQYSQDLGLTSAGGAGAGVLNLSLLTPGVTNGSAMGDGVGPSVGGQRPRDNNFTVEGVDNNNKSVTGALITVPPEAVENFTLLSNQFNSEFGHSSGGQFNTTVKSGTNSFHGSCLLYTSDAADE